MESSDRYTQSKHMHVKYQQNCPEFVPKWSQMTTKWPPNGSQMGSKTLLGVPIEACCILGRFWAFLCTCFWPTWLKKGSILGPCFFRSRPLGSILEGRLLKKRVPEGVRKWVPKRSPKWCLIWCLFRLSFWSFFGTSSRTCRFSGKRTAPARELYF